MTDDVMVPIQMLVSMPEGHKVVAVSVLTADPEGEAIPQLQVGCYRAQVAEEVYNKLWVARQLHRLAEEMELAHMAEGGAPDDTGTGYRVP